MPLNEEWIAGMQAQVREVLQGDYDVRESTSVPSADQVSLAKKAVKTHVCAVSLDIRDSSSLLDQHRRQTAGKIHKAFLQCAADAFREGGGAVRNFTGDGLLAFWPVQESEDIQSAFDAVAFFVDAFRLYLNKEFERYRSIDFGIGMEVGDVYVLKAGLEPGQHKSDLVYIGPCVNLACRMAKDSKSPWSIRFSPTVKAKLRPDQIFEHPQEWWPFKGKRYRAAETVHRGNTFACFERSDAHRIIQV